jgi:hypothetical protein
MQSMQEPAVAAFNLFIKSQLDVPGDAHPGPAATFRFRLMVSYHAQLKTGLYSGRSGNLFPNRCKARRSGL